MTGHATGIPSRARQAQAALALVTTLLLAAAVIVILGRNVAWLLVALVGVAIAVAGLWWVLTERLPRRAIGIVGLVVGGGVVVYAVVQATEGAQRPVIRLLILLALLAATAVLGRAALAPDMRELDQQLDVRPFVPTKPVLLCNPWSGGGKVEKFGLEKMADDLGIETVFLAKGLDLAELARDAIARGADCLGMAGGDGSQALVASIAHEHNLPFVCISAGTRNHFAQDLGFDKEDPRKGMVAFREGVERYIDLATVGDRLFVNNVSLGIYATIVQQDSYRDAKLETSRETLPKMLSKQAEPFDLQFTTPDGVEVDDSFVIMVSNNPYVLGPSLDLSQRRTMDSGKLGVFGVNAKSGTEAAAMVTRSTIGLGGRDPHVHQFTTETFEVRSRSGTCYAGVDGEALELETPLRFRVQPRALRLLVPKEILLVAEQRRARAFGLGDLWAVARGRRPARLDDLG
jgi:diacylglycerol kinase family enzyme